MSKLPFVMPAPFASQKRVLAHYFYPFPLSIDNKASASDYYNDSYLAPAGESDTHLSYGGFLRRRPLPVPAGPMPYPAYASANMHTEVQMAIARGITGFTVDVLNLLDALAPSGHLQLILAAAQAVDPRFWIVPMLDMSSMAALTQAQAVQLIASFAGAPSLAKLPDGRIVFSAYDATVQPLPWWQGVMAALNAKGIYAAFVPVLLGEPSSNPLAAVSHGLGGWGTATPAAAASCPPSFMMPVMTQQFRPYAQVFWEASNFDAFVASWMAAINAPSVCEWVQIVTWSDFSESSQVEPCTDATLSTGVGSGFYDLTAYYATWFSTGVQPPITEDVLYWSYRPMPSTAAHANQADAFKVNPNGGGTEVNNIECLAFLTAPGTVLINGTPFMAAAGITSFKIPAVPGQPTMVLQRDGSDVFVGTCPVMIYGVAGSPTGTLDLTYASGSISNG